MSRLLNKELFWLVTKIKEVDICWSIRRAFLPLVTTILWAVSKRPGGAGTVTLRVPVETGTATAAAGLSDRCSLAPAIILRWIQSTTDRWSRAWQFTKTDERVQLFSVSVVEYFAQPKMPLCVSRESISNLCKTWPGERYVSASLVINNSEKRKCR